MDLVQSAELLTSALKWSECQISVIGGPIIPTADWLYLGRVSSLISCISDTSIGRRKACWRTSSRADKFPLVRSKIISERRDMTSQAPSRVTSSPGHNAGGNGNKGRSFAKKVVPFLGETTGTREEIRPMGDDLYNLRIRETEAERPSSDGYLEDGRLFAR